MINTGQSENTADQLKSIYPKLEKRRMNPTNRTTIPQLILLAFIKMFLGSYLDLASYRPNQYFIHIRAFAHGKYGDYNPGNIFRQDEFFRRHGRAFPRGCQRRTGYNFRYFNPMFL